MVLLANGPDCHCAHTRHASHLYAHHGSRRPPRKGVIPNNPTLLSLDYLHSICPSPNIKIKKVKSAKV